MAPSEAEYGPEQHGDFWVLGKCCEAAGFTTWRLTLWKSDPPTLPSKYLVADEGTVFQTHGDSVLGGYPTFAPGQREALQAALERWKLDHRAREAKQEPSKQGQASPIPGTEDLQLLRTKEVVALTGFSATKVYHLIASGLLPSVRSGRVVRVPVVELRKWLAENTRRGRA